MRWAAATVALSLALAACGSTSSFSSSSSASGSSSLSTTASAAKAPLTGRVRVAISNFSYHPATIAVVVGTKVTFTNHDQTAHTATSTKPGFDTGTVNPGHSATIDFTKPGIYTYYCQFHAFMRATIVVK